VFQATMFMVLNNCIAVDQLHCKFTHMFPKFRFASQQFIEMWNGWVSSRIYMTQLWGVFGALIVDVNVVFAENILSTDAKLTFLVSPLTATFRSKRVHSWRCKFVCFHVHGD
jgi:hypothetical protein